MATIDLVELYRERWQHESQMQGARSKFSRSMSYFTECGATSVKFGEIEIMTDLTGLSDRNNPGEWVQVALTATTLFGVHRLEVEYSIRGVETSEGFVFSVCSAFKIKALWQDDEYEGTFNLAASEPQFSGDLHRLWEPLMHHINAIALMSFAHQLMNLRQVTG